MPNSPMKSDRPDGAAPLKRGLEMARRSWVLILICVILVPVAALLYSKSQTKEYTATSSLLFSNQSAEARIFGLEPSGNTDPAREAATNLKLASLQAISTRTAEALPKSHLDEDEIREKISVSPEGESELINVSATDPSPAFAAKLANTFSEQFIDFSREIESAKVRRAQKLAETKLQGLPEAERAGPAGETLEKRVRELETLAVIQTGRAELAQVATAPTSPSSPKTKRNVALGILLGILLAIGVVLLREQFDRRIRSTDELEELFGVPILGTIPESGKLAKASAHMDAGVDPAVAEAFRTLRTNLRYYRPDTERGTLLFTSGAPQDGKTMTSWNVARAEAAAGQRVLLLEADMRKPTLGKALGVATPSGLALVLAGVNDPGQAILRIKGVDLLPCGPVPPNAGMLLESDRMAELLAWAEQNYDRVIIDTPPASLVADAVPLFRRVDGIVIVARVRGGNRDAAEDLRDQLRTVQAPVLGIVVNGAPRPAKTDYYSSGGMSARFEERQDPPPRGPLDPGGAPVRNGRTT